MVNFSVGSMFCTLDALSNIVFVDLHLIASGKANRPRVNQSNDDGRLVSQMARLFRKVHKLWHVTLDILVCELDRYFPHFNKH